MILYVFDDGETLQGAGPIAPNDRKAIASGELVAIRFNPQDHRFERANPDGTWETIETLPGA